jgi:glyoxylase-like metal-dependent hydrolase (beta-lactamase superfamily II)
VNFTGEGELIRETFPVGLLQCNCTVLGDEESKEALVFDPGADLPRILAALAKHGLTLKQIVVTHAHFEHIAGAQELKRLTGAPIAFNQADLPLAAMLNEQPGWVGLRMAPVDRLPELDVDLRDGQRVGIRNVDGIAILTPGHTQGSLCVWFPEDELLIAGDTLFAGSIGRSDLPGGDGRQLLRSIKDRLLGLPEQTLVVPGHGGTTSIGTERDRNPFLQPI